MSSKKIRERGHCSVATVQKENVMLSSALNAWKRKQSGTNLTNQPQKRQVEAHEKNKAQDENETMEKKKRKMKKKGREKW